MSKQTKTSIGTFTMSRPEARITDPCYDHDTWCAGTIDDCKIGIWNAEVIKQDEGSWGERVAYLIAYHEDYRSVSPDSSKWELTDIDVGVDSGQAGIFDKYHFKSDDSVAGVERIKGPNNSPICEDEPFYSICCDRTLSEQSAGTIPFGCVSSSGFGDGSYRASFIKQGDKVVAIMIDYGLNYEEEDEYCEDCGGKFEYGDLISGICRDCEARQLEEMEKDAE